MWVAEKSSLDFLFVLSPINPNSNPNYNAFGVRVSPARLFHFSADISSCLCSKVHYWTSRIGQFSCGVVSHQKGPRPLRFIVELVFPNEQILFDDNSSSPAIYPDHRQSAFWDYKVVEYKGHSRPEHLTFLQLQSALFSGTFS